MILHKGRFESFVNRKPLTMTIGNFDGLHIGHRELINKLKYEDSDSAVLTFYPHPMKVLREMSQHQVVTSIDQKIELIEQCGVNHLFLADFDRKTASITKEEFIGILKSLNVIRLVLGVDFRFGQHAKGHIQDLMDEFEVVIVNDIKHLETRVSTTYIKDLIYSGELDKAERLLGRTYSIRGEVIHGDKVGRTLGMPTANLDVDSYVLPPNGVYFVGVIVKGQTYTGALNIGYNPTINYSVKKRVEVYILDFDQTIYGETVEIFFKKYLRAEKQYKSKDELMTQLRKDIEDVKILSSI